MRTGLLLLCVGLAWLQPGWAETVHLSITPAIRASADYEAGRPGYPAVLVLHGFLQTNRYLTLQNVKAAVTESGAAYLAPTLSLGVTDRKLPLACEAVHTHTMDDDLLELARWVEWLQDQGHDRIVLIGHSFGSITALAYLEKLVKQAAPLPVAQYIAISLTDSDYARENDSPTQERAAARQRLASGDTDLHAYQLSYCRRYMAPAAAFLSYADWTGERILKTVAVVGPAIDFTALLGSEDKRVPPSWAGRLERAGATVRVVPGANHFFDGEHEFDLLDVLDRVLKEAREDRPAD